MSKEVYLCENEPRHRQTQFRYTPDPGEVEGPVFCGVCKTKMAEIRNVDGPRGFVQAITGGSSPHDVFTCPKQEEEWHVKVVAIRKEAGETASDRLRDMLLEEADEVLKPHLATPVGRT